MPTVRITQGDAADELLGRDRLALPIGMPLTGTCVDEVARALHRTQPRWDH